MLDRKKAPEYKQIKPFQIEKPDHTVLDNGVHLWAFHSKNPEVCKLEFIFRAGNWYEKKPGISFFTINMLADGTAKRKSEEISNLIDGYGAFLELNHGMDYSTMVLYTPSKFLSQVLLLAREIMFEANFPDKELNIRKQRRVQQLKIEEKKNNVLATKRMKEALFQPNHPYGRRLTESKIKDIDVNEIINFHKHIILSSFEVILSGAWNQDHIKLINQYFGQRKLEPNSATAFFPLGSQETGRIYIEKPKSVQSSIRIGTLSIRKKDEDYIKLMLTNVVFGGYFGSRLIKNIREEKGLTYGISSLLVNLKNHAYQVIATEANKDLTENVVEEVYNEIDNICRNDIPQEELDTARNYLLGNFLSQFSNVFSFSEKFKNVHLYEMDLSYYDRFFREIKNVTPSDCREMANKYLKTNEFSEVIVG
jgi:predicted Zn-dependent peptidase